MNIYEIGEWQATPWLLLFIGYPPKRRLVTLNYYHVFSEWEYAPL